MKVSVIIAAFNSEKTITDTIQSLVNQTLKSLEIVIVNDGSKDKTLDIIEELAQQYSNIKIVNHETNLGIGKTRNDGIAAASGEYFGFVDADDYVDESMYEAYYTKAKEEDCDIVTGHYYKVIDGEKQFFHVDTFEKSNYRLNPKLVFLMDYGPCNKLFKRDMIQNNDIKFDEVLKYEDTPFVFKSIYHANNIYHLDKGFYYYRIRKGSETTTYDEKVFDMYTILDEINAYGDAVMSDELSYFNIQQITRYMLQQRYQKDKSLRDEFIRVGYDRLNKLDHWKSNPYFKKEPMFKKIIKKHKFLLKLYCALYLKVKGSL